ncbi:MAG: hypothetical protein Ta2B_25580 [Termitinemataceae bacterium]|nr:MAG: hypothetical protein Ta2B_25580 [Termitinemataceae bacterium]
MPSLKDLEEFQKSFADVGFEKTIMEKEGIRSDKYELPENEPVPKPQDTSTAPVKNDDGADGGIDLGEDSPTPAAQKKPPPSAVPATRAETTEKASPDAKPAASAAAEFGDATKPSASSVETAPSKPPPSDDVLPPDLDLDEPSDEGSGIDDLLNGFSDFAKASKLDDAQDIAKKSKEAAEAIHGAAAEQTSAPESDADTAAANVSADADSNFGGIIGDSPEDGAAVDDSFSPEIDFGDLDLDGGLDADATDTGNADDSGFGDLDLGGTATGDDGISGDLDIADINLDAAATEQEQFIIDEDLPSDEDFPSVSDVTDEEMASLAPSALPIGEDAPAPINEELPVIEEFAADGGNEEQAPTSELLPDLDDFDLPPIDETPKTKTAKEVLAEESPIAEEKIEAISLSNEDLDSLLETLASYPLNLRIACEQVIAEEVVPPGQLSSLIRLLINNASPREVASLVGKILNKKIILPKNYKTGEELEEEQESFAYIFINKFFPIARLALLIAAVVASIVYLTWQFIVIPIDANNIYKQGYKQIEEGQYDRANQLFSKAFAKKHVKDWFYKYAEKFTEERQYILAEKKYDDLLIWYPHDKKAALDYATLEKDLRNYEKADNIIRRNILDYKVDDPEGLIALGDINLDWGEYLPERYEEARQAYARYITAYGQSDPILERMLKYFIRTDNLGEVLPLQEHFMADPKTKISAWTLAELGGYLLDKHFEVSEGVPDENIERISGIKDVLLRSVKTDPALPESHYHLARYYHNYGATLEERQTLQNAAAAFDAARPESPKRSTYRIDTQEHIATLLVKDREFHPAEEALVKGINIYEDAISRRILGISSKFGKLYADLGDLEYFTKEGDMQRAIDFYLGAERNAYAPPEIQYRLGSAYYILEQYENAQDRYFRVLMEMPYNRRLLNAMGNVSYKNADFFAAQGYYQKLLSLLESDRNRLPMLLPNERPEHRELVERMMLARNNLGVTFNALSARTGDPGYRAKALALFAESARAWDTLERDPITMVRPGTGGLALPGASLPYLNIKHTLYPVPGDEGALFMEIDKDVNEPSQWEELMKDTQ